MSVQTRAEVPSFFCSVSLGRKRPRVAPPPGLVPNVNSLAGGFEGLFFFVMIILAHKRLTSPDMHYLLMHQISWLCRAVNHSAAWRGSGR